MNRRLILLFLTVMSCISSVIAQVSFDVTVAEKKRIVSGAFSYKQSDDVTFANALLWAVDQGPQRKEEIIDCDFVKRQFTMVYKLSHEGGMSYTCRMSVKVAQGQVMFLISDVKMQGNLISAFVGFDKLNPEKKTKHRDIINDFQTQNNQKLQEFITFVQDNKPVITNWKGVCLGKIEKGMSADEARLIYGKPISTQDNGTESQYVFSTFIYVFLENGKVKSFVN